MVTLLHRSKGRLLGWVLTYKFYGIQKALWGLDEETEDKDQQATKEWCKSFNILRVILRIAVVWVDLQAIIPTLAVLNYVQLHVITLNKHKDNVPGISPLGPCPKELSI